MAHSSPNTSSSLPTTSHPGRWWHAEPDSDRILCTLCPRACRLRPGDRGFCFVRENRDGQMVLDTYGRSTGFCIDPIEKKPLNHFLPGTPVLSFGTAGCNLGCKFCQNWDISKSREVRQLSALAEPARIAQAALDHDCQSVAFTYNDPVIWAEYAIDTAIACHALGVKTVAVTAGYITAEARPEFFQHMDAANVDLKAFDEDFYHRVTGSHLQDVLDTLVFLRRETNVWFEITNLVIPRSNDGVEELRRMCGWIAEALGPDVPLHFSAFHPDFRMTDRPPTPPETLIRAQEIAQEAGLHYCYVGNVHDPTRQNTYCPGCGSMLIERDWYQLGQYRLRDRNQCPDCGHTIPGVFQSQPGNWGRRRQPIDPSRSVLPILDTEPTTATPSPNPTAAVPIKLPAEHTTAPMLPELTDEQQQQICHAAAKHVLAAAQQQPASAVPMELPHSLADLPINGLFVTLRHHGQLRGCCGQLTNPMPLGEVLVHAARRTTLNDPRFPAVQPAELAELTLECSLLGPYTPIPGPPGERHTHLQIGRDGLRIRYGQAAGLLLPQVATEQGWDAEQFLGGVCRKAGLPIDAWRDEEAFVETFPGIHFGGPFPADVLAANPSSNDTTPARISPEPTLLTSSELKSLIRWCGGNLQALARGATPSYYAVGVSDTNVAGIILTLQNAATKGQMQLAKISPSEDVALQSTLFTLCQSAAQWLASQPPIQRLQLGLTLLDHPVPVGPLTDAFKSADTGQPIHDQAWWATRGDHWALVFDPHASAYEQLVATLQDMLGPSDQPAQLHRFRCQTNMPTLRCGRLPNNTNTTDTRPIGTAQQIQPTARPAAVGGRFYPAGDQERNALVSDLLAQRVLPTQNLAKSTDGKITARAIMTPHAGLTYSGKVAAGVWGSIQIPDHVWIIGPKHTRAGANWAIAPHDRWQLGDQTVVMGDVASAKMLSEQLDGFVLDADAHAQEHGIEVQLPFLHQLAPEAKVTAIAMGPAEWPQIQHAAEQLANVLAKLPQMPLLVISSDMNHFAEDAENRRRDALALQAFEAGEPRQLLDTCQQHQISMCGVIPAALVLATLRQLQPEFHVHRIDYATSADVSGDRSRVVGYASAVIT